MWNILEVLETVQLHGYGRSSQGPQLPWGNCYWQLMVTGGRRDIFLWDWGHCRVTHVPVDGLKPMRAGSTNSTECNILKGGMKLVEVCIRAVQISWRGKWEGGSDHNILYTWMKFPVFVVSLLSVRWIQWNHEVRAIIKWYQLIVES